jgi:tripeptide aminopeptidase
VTTPERPGGAAVGARALAPGPPALASARVRRASEAERARLNETFADLCRIRSPSYQEDECAAWVRAQLAAMGIAAEEDAAGNLLARIPGRREPGVLLCAHIDTVDPVAPIEPVLVDGGWENAHDGILGADNKAAVAAMLETARRLSVEGSPVAVELLFTRAEEDALAGAKAFDASRLRSEFGFVYDHATPVGEIVVASPTYFRIEAEFRGRAAHAGIRPQDGRSAILAAARAIAAMPHGRLDAETTANVGSVQGGVGSTNVVAERCRFLAETRSLDPAKAEASVAAIIDAIHDAASDSECDVDVMSERLFSGYRVKGSSPALAAAETALRACGYEPSRIVTGGGADANALEAQGFHCINLANGTERNHEPGERVPVAALEAMLDVTFELLEACAP